MVLLRRAATLAFVSCLLAALWFSAKAQDQNNQYFPETGHNVQGDFLRFYSSIPDPTTIYGYPITEEFTRKDGLQVQYFQRARFEYHPELPAGQRVTLTDLGTQMYTPSTQLNVFNPFACHLYSQTNFAVCFAFLDFYNKYGGTTQFGYPISPFEYHDGLIVQYFQRARLEWQPSNPEGERVVLTNLGSLYFEKLSEDPALKDPDQPLNASIQPAVTSLQLRAFVWKAVTVKTDRQTIFIIVNDQSGRPLNNSACRVTVHWQHESAQVIGVATNSSGIAIIPFSFANEPSGNLIPVDINCAYENLNGSTTTSFRVWY
ncbi:MAG TPA: hypothetical protein VLX61_12685 [Anaerolineales bacterium]|nr:hypothetical protein [Anaerolineales bacterium]